jgi:hypothetical protein
MKSVDNTKSVPKGAEAEKRLYMKQGRDRRPRRALDEARVGALGSFAALRYTRRQGVSGIQR